MRDAARASTVLLLGRPEAGTPMMVAAPLAAIDLPMRVLIAEDADGGCRISYHPAAGLLVADVAAQPPDHPSDLAGGR